MNRLARKTAALMTAGALGVAGFAFSPLTGTADADIVDDAVCYVKTGDGYRCFRWGP